MPTWASPFVFCLSCTFDYLVYYVHCLFCFAGHLMFCLGTVLIVQSWLQLKLTPNNSLFLMCNGHSLLWPILVSGWVSCVYVLWVCVQIVHVLVACRCVLVLSVVRVSGLHISFCEVGSVSVCLWANDYQSLCQYVPPAVLVHWSCRMFLLQCWFAFWGSIALNGLTSMLMLILRWHW